MTIETPIPNVHYSLSTSGTFWKAPGRPDLSAIARENLVPGAYKPDATTTGVTDPSVVLVDVIGNVSFSVNDAVIPEYRRYMGKVSVTAKRLKFKNSKFQGPASAVGSDPIIACTNVNVQDIVFEDCEMAAVSTNSGTNIINGHDFTLRRCNLHHAVDLVGVIPSTTISAANVYVIACYMHDPVFYSPDPNQPSNFTHNDLIQWHGGSNLQIIGTTMLAIYAQDRGDSNDPKVVGPAPDFPHLSGNPYYPLQQATSCLLVNTHVGAPQGLLINQSWLDGGAVAINLASSPASFLAAGSAITNNKFGRNFRLGEDFAILATSSQVFTLTGNTREDDGTPFNVRKNG